MQRKYIIVLSVVVLILFGYIGYRHYTRKAELDADLKKTDSIMLAMARTSAAGGMTQMAMALRRYELGAGEFPRTLQALYPDYMRSKPFIEEIAWEYELRGRHDFLLKKRFTRNEKEMVASVDKTLRTRIHTSFMVASAGDTSKTEIAQSPETSKTTQPAMSEQAEAIPPMERRLQALVQKTPPTETKRVSEEESSIAQPIPEPFTVVDAQTCSGFPVEASGRHLVWKDKEGVLGFGNVDYPDAGKLTICADGQWVSVKRAPQETRESEELALTGLEPRRTFFGVEIR